MKSLKLLPLVLLLISGHALAEVDFFAAIKEARALEARLAIPELEVKAPVAGVEWVTDQATFDYVMPCPDISYIAIVSNVANHKDPLVENSQGERAYWRDTTVAYSRMADYCIVIGAPKTGTSTTYDENNNLEYWRNWWMTAGVEDDNGIPVRDENDEIEATIALIKLAIAVTARPVYLVMSNDLGESSAKVLNRLMDDGEDKLVSGFIQIDYKTGEFTTYHRDGTIWLSKDNPVSE
jgi:hypothetical protein